MRAGALDKRFWSKVRKADPDGCWEWTASLNTCGYGQIAMGHATPRHAHRIAWLLANGEVPEGMHVLHHCDNRKCCNPAHLFLGTNADNIADRVAKGRSTVGEKDGNAKLTEADVRRIRALGGKTDKEVAKEFGISASNIWYIRHFRSWRHVQ